MRRFVVLVLFVLVSVPFGVSVTGCGHKSAPVIYCNANDSGPVVGQVAQIILSPTLATTGESLNYGQIGQTLSATALDCKGNTVSVPSYTYASTSSYNVSANGTVFADINPSTGQVCGGTWNRNSGGGVADYTICTAPTAPSGYLAYVTATASGAVSNAIPVYVHAPVTSVVLGAATPGAANGTCPAGTTDPGTDCCPNSTNGTTSAATIYDGTSCISQNTTGQLVARIYAGTTNITCQVGHVSYGTQNASNVVTIDANGVATAVQPGSTQITATIAQSSTAANAGFFSTCPPASIHLDVTSNGASSATVPINNALPLTATVIDTKGAILSGVSLSFESTNPQNIPASSGTITPVYPGTAQITALCQPGTCNPAGFSQIGVFGNGKLVMSNPVTINATGQVSTVLYAGSIGQLDATGNVIAGTGSQYLYTVDFTTSQPGTLVKLPYVPNSMVINLAGSEIYMGSAGGLMTVNTTNNVVTAANQTILGKVLSISPDSSTLVVTDPVKQTISLVSTTSSTATTTYGGVATRAQWTPDSNRVYITTTTGTVLTHSTFTNWQTSSASQIYNDIAVAVPSIGAYFAGPSSADGYSACPSTTATTSGNPPTATNNFLPLADSNTTAIMDRIAATNDGSHILGAHATTSGVPTFTDLNVTLPIQKGTATDSKGNALYGAACPSTITPGYFTSAAFTAPLTTTTSPATSVNATAITGVDPSSNAKVAFVTYNGTSGLLPYYIVPTPGSLGQLNYLPLASGTSPLAGVFSADDSTFYVGTAGDDLIHQIAVTYPTTGSPTATETGTLTPQLPAASGSGYAPVNIILQHPKKATN